MLKGINIGGNNRLEYLSFLKKKQDENIEILEKIYLNNKRNKKEKENESNEKNSKMQLFDDENNKNDCELNEKDDVVDVDDDGDENNDNVIINQNINLKRKYEEEIDYIEQEILFYNFDENLLQYRPLEIDYLIRSLIDLKESLILTSKNQNKEKIINYSNSLGIFRNFKNFEAASICQSNIGNLQMQLHKYDKAIYHLASSLLDKKF